MYIIMKHACGLDFVSMNISFLGYKSFYQLNQMSLIVYYDHTIPLSAYLLQYSPAQQKTHLTEFG